MKSGNTVHSLNHRLVSCSISSLLRFHVATLNHPPITLCSCNYPHFSLTEWTHVLLCEEVRLQQKKMMHVSFPTHFPLRFSFIGLFLAQQRQRGHAESQLTCCNEVLHPAAAV
ncbi:hypothetical protein DQ04_07531060 [Trypanosoma grayi]|uniref:hypothetical protein n=1 Tax=Trypanosoma grayi TaxID=71804 RepID=UPI0004F4A03F|nr:hypothetical protein DQ04_07531060 [Trypanosoma grayi]KEG08287.1 hypothetical protein DQ04_07531060 [Trypanosoma grayi]